MKILVTGGAGFIGSNLCRRLVERGDDVVALDNINDYYDVELKYSRLSLLGIDKSAIQDKVFVQSRLYNGLRFVKINLSERESLQHLFEAERFDKVCNLAAQAGVRYSLENPYAYVESNLIGFVNLLECMRHYPVKHFVFASSSSVYGMNSHVPFSEEDKTDKPVSLYAATKKSDELMAHVYAHLYRIPMTGLRYFTVYGPWGRPDMAPSLFVTAIQEGRPIKVFNNGNLSRDFTYIDDIVEATVKAIDYNREEEHIYDVYNVGCGHPVPLMDFIHIMEENLGKKAILEMYPMQPGDVYQTYANSSKFEQTFGFKPSVTLGEGLAEFVAWHKSYNCGE